MADSAESAVSPRAVSYEIKQVKRKAEDTFATLDANIGNELVHLVLVADGHGGPLGAQVTAAALLAEIEKEAQDASAAELARAMRASFHLVSDTIRKLSNSGAACTVVAIVARTGMLTAANVGDVVRPTPLLPRPALAGAGGADAPRSSPCAAALRSLPLASRRRKSGRCTSRPRIGSRSAASGRARRRGLPRRTASSGAPSTRRRACRAGLCVRGREASPWAGCATARALSPLYTQARSAHFRRIIFFSLTFV